MHYFEYISYKVACRLHTCIHRYIYFWTDNYAYLHTMQIDFCLLFPEIYGSAAEIVFPEIYKFLVWRPEYVKAPEFASLGSLNTRMSRQNFSFPETLFSTRLHSSRMRTARLLHVSPSMHSPGGSAPGGGCLLWWGVPVSGPIGGSAPGVSAPRGGVCSWVGVAASGPGGVSQHAMGQNPSCEQNSWQTLLKILPCPNFVAGGNYI